MQANIQNAISQIIPYDLNTIIHQIYQYKCFEIDINRALLLGDKKISKVCLINNYWSNHWKKVSCYQILKDEVEINCQNNNINVLSNGLCNIFQNINSFEKFDVLDHNIENDDIKGENISNIQQTCVDWESEFDIISPELWNLFAPMGNMNQNTNINFNLENLSNDSKMVSISDQAIYVIFWNHEKQKLGKFILKFEDDLGKPMFLQSMQNGLSFRELYKTYLSDIPAGSEKDINYNGTISIKCLNKTEISLPSKNPSKSPLGLRNIQMTCYMNSALQSLFNVKKLTNYLIGLKNIILSTDLDIPLLKAYVKTILNLSRKAQGSKKLTEYSPTSFFNSIRNESEFNELAGDSYDVVRHFFQKAHEQLLFITQENYSVFDKYIIKNPNMSNNLTPLDVQNLNTAINNYSSSNRSIIANLFYYMERSITKCSLCGFSTSNFNVQMSIIFPLEDIRQWKYQKMLDNMRNQNNNNMMNNVNNANMNNMINNFNNMNQSINQNNNMNMNQSINQNNNMNINNNVRQSINANNNIMNNPNNNMMNNMNNNNPNIMNNNNMNNNMNNMSNDMNNNMVNNMNNNMVNNMNNNMVNNMNNNMVNNMNNNMGNNMGNNMNNFNNNINNNNMNIRNNPGGGGMMNGNYNTNQNNMNFNPNQMGNNLNNMNNIPNIMNMNAMNNQMVNNQMANMNQIMNNNMIVQNMFMNNMFLNVLPQPTSVELQDGFEHYKKDNWLQGQNQVYCVSCKQTCNNLQSNHFYTLPEYLVCNLNRGKANVYKVGITFPEILDLTNEVQTNLDSHKYRLICIVTHIGPHGTGGHYIAFCFLEEKKMWYQFNDSIVKESNFNEASTFGDTYILFYRRM